MRWSTLLVSLLALTPLWKISQSLTQMAITGKKTAKIEAALTSCGLSEVRVVYENSGEISGIVTSVRFALLRDGLRAAPGLKIARSNGAGDIVVSPKEGPIQAVYKAYIDNTEADFVSGVSSAKSCVYLLEFDWLDFAGTKNTFHRECSCP